MKIGLFGGTFDPVHRGHLEIARQAIQQCSLELIFFIPAFLPPNKVNQISMTPADLRLEMLRLATEKEKYFKIWPGEINRQGISYTVDTVKAIGKEYPAAQLFWVMGEDSYETLLSWKDFDELKRLLKFAVAPRHIEGRPALIEGTESFWIDMPAIDLASTEIRRQLAAGAQTIADVPDPVLRFISENKLYREGGSRV